MQAMLDSCKQSVLRLTLDLASPEFSSYKPESLELGRYVAKVALILTEIELHSHVDDSLRGSKDLFLAAECTLEALVLAENLVHQSATSGKAQIWALEDAAEFQSVTLELLDALVALSRVRSGLPADVRQDIVHFIQQFETLQFTATEMEETEELEMLEAQKEVAATQPNKLKVPKKPLGVDPATPTGTGTALVPAVSEWPDQRDQEESDEEYGHGIAFIGEEEDEDLMARTEYVPLTDPGIGASEEDLPEDPFEEDRVTRVKSGTLHELEALKISNGSRPSKGAV